MTEMTRDAQFRFLLLPKRRIRRWNESSPLSPPAGGSKRGGSKGEGERERYNGSTVICGGRKVDSGGENGTAFRPAKMSSKSGMAGGNGCSKKRQVAVQIGGGEWKDKGRGIRDENRNERWLTRGAEGCSLSWKKGEERRCSKGGGGCDKGVEKNRTTRKKIARYDSAASNRRI